MRVYNPCAHHEMSLQQSAWGTSDAALEVSLCCLTFGCPGGTPLPAPSVGKGPGLPSAAYPQTAYLFLAYIFKEKGISSLRRSSPSGVGWFLFYVAASSEVPSVSSLGVSGKSPAGGPQRPTLGTGSDRVRR